MRSQALLHASGTRPVKRGVHEGVLDARRERLNQMPDAMTVRRGGPPGWAKPPRSTVLDPYLALLTGAGLRAAATAIGFSELCRHRPMSNLSRHCHADERVRRSA